MSTISCDWCGGWIDSSNLRWPGYCSAACRDLARLARQARQATRRQVSAEDDAPPRMGAT